MLGPDIGMKEPIGFFGGERQHALGFRAEWNLDRRRDLFAKHRPPFDLFPDALEREMRARENPTREAFAFTNQSEQQVLGLNRRTAELRRLVASNKENTTRTFRIAFKHAIFRRRSGRASF